MGSDSSPLVLFEAVLQAIKLLDSNDTLVIFSTQNDIDTLPIHLLKKKNQIEIKVTSDPILMSDEPLFAVRQKKKSSIVLGIKELKRQKLDAFVSAGNTGALIASATFYLSKLQGVNRPALLALLPTKKGSVAVIDVGGNISAKAEVLVQFAEMGAAFQSCNLNIEAPRVGLLNIGTESKKGTLEVRQAYQQLQTRQEMLSSQGFSPKMNFVGNIEGREVFQGKVDVLVTSGMTGNVLLKTAEGVASFILEQLSAASFSEEGKEYFEKLQKQFNSAEYPGAILAGVDGIVIKCHGAASKQAMYNSIKGAIELHRQNFLSKLKTRLSH